MPYSELSEEGKTIYDKTKKQLDESMKNPFCLGKDDTLYFPAARVVMRKIETKI